MQKKVSIIIPVYNKELYIEECLKSIEMQTYKNTEVILVDDGSTDESFQKIQCYLKESKLNIKIFQQENKGPSVARNLGIENLLGELVLFVDADDVLKEDCIEKSVAVLEKHGVDIVEFDFGIYGKREARKVPYKEIVYRDNAEAIRKMLQKEEIKPVVCGAMFREKVVKKCLFLEGVNWGEDSCFKLDSLLCAEKIAYFNEELYINRLLENNTLSRQPYSEQMIDSILVYLGYYYKKLSNVIYTDKQVKRILLRRILGHINTIIKTHAKDRCGKGWNKLRDAFENFCEGTGIRCLDYKMVYFFMINFEDIYLSVYMYVKRIKDGKK